MTPQRPPAHDDRRAERRARTRAASRSRLRRQRALVASAAIAAAAILALALSGVMWSGASHAGNRDQSGLGAGTGTVARAGARGTALVTKPATDDEAHETPAVRHLIALGKPIYCAAPRGNEVALTFDDGPGQYTWLALPKLRKHHVKATFFVVGRNIALLPPALREERALGSVGDHTFTHPLLTSLAPSEAEAQIVHTQQAIEHVAGGPVFLFRPPYGARDATIDRIAQRHNLLEIMWTVDSRDSLGANYAEIERNAIDGLKPGSIVLMHENHGQTIRAMLGIFAAIQRKHLRTVSVPRLLSDDTPSDAQVRAGGAGCGSLYRPGGNGG
ncbi:MAG TPA: polysaccharide deacetylase family protein [Solirubrobacteraceae bacterium]|jgi:peptidoglycan/xylan/chitin deacetylase (PgdA/CDA1 family)|nr:polysaccharide deacetylase family protein [Solirubrobacteraceae bacterium]